MRQCQQQQQQQVALAHADDHGVALGKAAEQAPHGAPAGSNSSSPPPFSFRSLSTAAAAADREADNASAARHHLMDSDFGQWSVAFRGAQRTPTERLRLLESMRPSGPAAGEGSASGAPLSAGQTADPTPGAVASSVYGDGGDWPMGDASGTQLSLLEVELRSHSALRARAKARAQALGQLHDRSVSAVRAELRAKPAKSKKGPLAERVGIGVADSGGEAVAQSLRLAISDNLKHAVNQTVSMKLTRKLTATLTVSLTDSLVKLLMNSITAPYVDTSHRILVHTLLPALTHSLSAVIVKSMSRHPQEDYFCYYCKHKKIYCRNCKDSATNDHWIDYYTSYYAQYYADYYDRFYSVQATIYQLVQPSEPYEEPSADQLKYKPK